MPKLNGTGPKGKGSGTGKGLGKCKKRNENNKKTLLEKIRRVWNTKKNYTEEGK